MADHDAQVTAATLVFARTPHGVVKILAGERVPDDVLPGEIQRLQTAGAVTEAQADPKVDQDDATDSADDPVAVPQPPRTRRDRKAPEA